jgi:cyclopropane-fatty-acyl-phospholipid synthase
MATAQETVKELLALADIKVNGKRPFDIQVHDDRLYKRILAQGTMGLGESYMEGWWDVPRLDELICRVQSANLQSKIRLTPAMVRVIAKAMLTNQQTMKRARKNASHHYNIGNDLYERMLDKRMIYSCGYWKTATTLEDAQIDKLDLVCQKLHLKKGMTLLDIGCGWGGFAEYAAKNYGVKVTGISPASEQVKLAKQRTTGLDVKIEQKDYREVNGSYDRIVSIGMLEHVGSKNYQTFFTHCQKMLKDGGLMLHHTIGQNHSDRGTNAWIDKYIFPGAVLPSIAQIAKAIEKSLIIEDIHSFGPYYDQTLMAWHNNFVKHYAEIKDQYDERFYRMWEFYLLACAGSFRARHLQLWQVVMRKIEASPVYTAVR